MDSTGLKGHPELYNSQICSKTKSKIHGQCGNVFFSFSTELYGHHIIWFCKFRKQVGSQNFFNTNLSIKAIQVWAIQNVSNTTKVQVKDKIKNKNNLNDILAVSTLNQLTHFFLLNQINSFWSECFFDKWKYYKSIIHINDTKEDFGKTQSS